MIPLKKAEPAVSQPGTFCGAACSPLTVSAFIY
jgi:hypothetical protein